MYQIRKFYGCVVETISLLEKAAQTRDPFLPKTEPSTNWKNWMTVEDEKRCESCKEHQGKLYPIDNPNPNPKPPMHPRCRCVITTAKAMKAGKASRKGEDGADYHVKHNSKLPDYYISKEEAIQLGWVRKKGNLQDVAPGKMISEVHRNDEKHLPDKTGRVWYEADLNYAEGYRTNHRLLYSNDGLIFVTYDHYTTFIEIT